LIGFLGGTFDPIHNGHLHAARCATERLGLERVHFVLAGQPSHRSAPAASIGARWAMLELAVAGDSRWRADDREIRRGGASYTVETLEELRVELGADVSLIWLLGWDAYRALPTWRRWRELLDLTHLGVMRRPGSDEALDAAMSDYTAAHCVDDPAELQGRAGGGVYVFAAPMLPISATDIRARLARGDGVGELLPSAVWTYIDQHHPYGGRTTE
jgi:nicotinate-nucleotide adenylyltransferase